MPDKVSILRAEGRAIRLAVAAASGAGLAQQVALTRIFSIAQWHHFAFMAISVAMLGYGLAGTLLAMLPARFAGREGAWFRGCAVALPPILTVSHALAQRVPFDSFALATQPGQLLNLLLLYPLLAAPFCVISALVTLALRLRAGEVGKVYGASMMGAGLGAAAVVALLYAVSPARIPMALALGLVPFAWLVAGDWSLPRRSAVFLVLLALVVGTGLQPIRISPFKGLPAALRFPDASVVARAHGPMSDLAVVASRYIRETPGQPGTCDSVSAPGLPEQRAVFFDADALSAVSRADDESKLGFLECVTSALVYSLVDRPDVAVIGSGGGVDVLMALRHGARRVTAVEADPGMVALMRGPLAEFNGGLYDRPDVELQVMDGRRFVRRAPRRFDVIQCSLTDSMIGAGAGMQALAANPLYTVEAVVEALHALSESGVLSVTRWLKTPPRDTLRMLATLAEGARRFGIETPADHLVFIRSWNTGTLLLSRSPLSPTRIEAVRKFSEEGSFDLCWLPGLRVEEANLHTLLERPWHFEAAQALLGPDREAFLRAYAFDLRPPTDDRPFFSQFFRWRTLPAMVKTMGRGWLPYAEWGYLILAATLAQAVLCGAALVLLPAWKAWGNRSARAGFATLAAYVACLGFAFMFLEMAAIQRALLHLAHPTYALCLVLSTLLICSGLGSLATERPGILRVEAVKWVILCLLITAALYVWLGPRAWNRFGTVAVIATLAPTAFLMGMPFPIVFRRVSAYGMRGVAWVWAINGCASVIGSVLGTLLAVHLGFTRLVIAAMALYTAAACLAERFRRGESAGADGRGSPDEAAATPGRASA